MVKSNRVSALSSWSCGTAGLRKLTSLRVLGHGGVPFSSPLATILPIRFPTREQEKMGLPLPHSARALEVFPFHPSSQKQRVSPEPHSVCASVRTATLWIALSLGWRAREGKSDKVNTSSMPFQVLVFSIQPLGFTFCSSLDLMITLRGR